MRSKVYRRNLIENDRTSDVVLPTNESGWRWAALVVVLFGLFLWGRHQEKISIPTTPARLDRWAQMDVNMQETIQNYGGDVGLYIKDLRTGRVIAHNADRAFVSASLIKLPIMVAVFEAIREGRISLNTRIRYSRSLRRDGSGNLKWARAGSYFSVSHLVYNMMTHSDNTATAMLINKLGYDYLNDCFAKMGLHETRISPVGMSLANHLRQPDQDNYTTPQEMGLLLEKIYKHELASDGLSDLMLEIMKGANSRQRLARDLPKDWKLARKTGLLRKNCHDVGIVFTPDGDYVICVLTGQNSSYRVAKGFISTVGQKAYSYFSRS